MNKYHNLKQRIICIANLYTYVRHLCLDDNESFFLMNSLIAIWISRLCCPLLANKNLDRWCWWDCSVSTNEKGALWWNLECLAPRSMTNTNAVSSVLTVWWVQGWDQSQFNLKFQLNSWIHSWTGEFTLKSIWISTMFNFWNWNWIVLGLFILNNLNLYLYNSSILYLGCLNRDKISLKPWGNLIGMGICGIVGDNFELGMI